MSNLPLATVALGGAVLALAVHVLAAVGRTPIGMAAIFVVFPVGFLCFGALILSANRRARERGDPRASVADLFAPLPAWARLLFLAVFLYTGLNFALFFRATGGGTFERQPDGAYVLSDHGRFIRALDERGVRALHAWQVRVFSGHVLPFLVLPACISSSRRVTKNAKRSASRLRANEGLKLSSGYCGRRLPRCTIRFAGSLTLGVRWPRTTCVRK